MISLLYVCLGPSHFVLYMMSFALLLFIGLFTLLLTTRFFGWSLQGDEKYRCSETGYRIPFKCEEIKDSTKDAKKANPQKTRSTLEISYSNATSHIVEHVSEEFITSQSQRTLLDDSSTSDNKSQGYVTYRSCIPADTEEKLSVLGFEVIFCSYLRFIIIFIEQLLNLVEWKNHIIY